MLSLGSLEVFTAVMFQVKVFWVVMLCCAVVGYQSFRCPCYLHLHPEDRGSTDLWNNGILLHSTTWRHDPEDLDL